MRHHELAAGALGRDPGQHGDDVFVRQAVEAVAADAPGRELARQRKFLRQRRLAAVEGGIEAGDLPHLGRGGADRPNDGDLVRLVQRGERHQLLEIGQQPAIDQRRLGILQSAMHHAVADAVESGLAADVTCEPVVDRRDRPVVAGAGDRLRGELAAPGIGDLKSRRDPDSLHLAVHARRKRSVGGGFEHREFDARRAGIDHQDGLSHRHRFDRAWAQSASAGGSESYQRLRVLWKRRRPSLVVSKL